MSSGAFDGIFLGAYRSVLIGPPIKTSAGGPFFQFKQINKMSKKLGFLFASHGPGGCGLACAWEPHGKRHRGPIGCEGVSHGGKCKGVASRWNERGFGFIKCPLRPFLFSGNIVVYSCDTCSQGTDAVVGKSLFCWQTRRWRRGRVLSLQLHHRWQLPSRGSVEHRQLPCRHDWPCLGEQPWIF